MVHLYDYILDYFGQFTISYTPIQGLAEGF